MSCVGQDRLSTQCKGEETTVDSETVVMYGLMPPTPSGDMTSDNVQKVVQKAINMHMLSVKHVDVQKQKEGIA